MPHSSRSRTGILITAGALAVLATGGTVAGVTAASAAPASHHATTTYITDHQLCYLINTVGPGVIIPPAGSVTLINQFSPSGFKPAIGPPTIHCNPVEKAVVGRPPVPITNPNAHLLCFPIRQPTQPAFHVSVTNQFGTAVLLTGQPFLLCPPTWKSLTGPPNMTPDQPPGLSHYVCYKVRVISGGYRPPTVALTDEFGGPTTVTVNPVPNRLCLPTKKIVVTPAGTRTFPIVAGAKHLLCFHVPPTPFVPLWDQDQFTNAGVPITLKVTDSLCLPSTKRIVS